MKQNKLLIKCLCLIAMQIATSQNAAAKLLAKCSTGLYGLNESTIHIFQGAGRLSNQQIIAVTENMHMTRAGEFSLLSAHTLNKQSDGTYATYAPVGEIATFNLKLNYEASANKKLPLPIIEDEILDPKKCNRGSCDVDKIIPSDKKIVSIDWTYQEADYKDTENYICN